MIPSLLLLALACDTPAPDDEKEGGGTGYTAADFRNVNLLFPASPDFGSRRDARAAGCTVHQTEIEGTRTATFVYDERGRLASREDREVDGDGDETIETQTYEWSASDCEERYTYEYTSPTTSSTTERVRTCDDGGNSTSSVTTVDGEVAHETVSVNDYDAADHLIGQLVTYTDHDAGESGINHVTFTYAGDLVSSYVVAYADADDTPSTTATWTYVAEGELIAEYDEEVCTAFGSEGCAPDDDAAYTFDDGGDPQTGAGNYRSLTYDSTTGDMTVSSATTWTVTYTPSGEGWPAEGYFIDNGVPIGWAWSLDCD